MGGKMEKLMAQSGYFGSEKWKTRLFRLFDEALVWFDDEPSFFKKLFHKKADNDDDMKENDMEYMTPFGVLPLAMITGLKTCDLSEDAIKSNKLTENELLRLELEIGDEGIIILKCSDFNQRIKWYECLHSAIFAVQRPLFTKDKDLWRIAEPKAESKDKTKKFSRQMTKEDVMSNDDWRKKAMHVRMGKSLAFKLNDFKIGAHTDNEIQIELQNHSQSFEGDDRSSRVPSLSNENSG